MENIYKNNKYKYLKKNKIGEVYSAVSHSIGALLAIAGLVIMLIKSNVNIIPIIIYGLGMVLLYTFSSLYHFFPDGKRVKRLFRKFDHICIYIFIASTYTPICAFSLPKNVAILILIIIWLCAFTGILFNTIIKYNNTILRVILYISMGWIIIFAFRPLLLEFNVLHLNGLILGGMFYTIGAFLYTFGKKLNDNRSKQFTHDIFHIFVLMGSFCHDWFIFSYVI